VVRSTTVGDAFSVDLSRQGVNVVCSVAGEIDLATAPTLVEAIESELASPAPETKRVVVDLSEVGFLDSSGLNALVRLEQTMDSRGVDVRIVSPSDRVVRQVFEITKLTEPLRVVESLDEALG
jgi:anti-sigma B factor antagonist